MSTPRIAPLTQALQFPGLKLASMPSTLPAEGDQIFVVTSGGHFAGHDLFAGDILVCRGAVRDGDEVVIMPRGRGGARLGHLDGHVVRGPSGEPCSGARWLVAGRLFAVVSAAGLTPVATPVRLIASPATRPAAEAPHTQTWRALARRDVAGAPERQQLSLFGRQAA